MRVHTLMGATLLLANACAPQPAAATPFAQGTQNASPIAALSPSPNANSTGSSTPGLDATHVWVQLASMPTPRSEMPAVELNGLIYVPGGFGPRRDGLANGYGPVDTFDVYDPATDKWRSLAPMPEPRHHLMLTVYKDRIYAFGGFIDPWIMQSNAWVYDPASDHWDILKPMPAPRTAGAAVTLGDKIYLVGGTSSQAGVALPTWSYDPVSDTWRDRAPLQQPREHNAAVSLDGKIYALGGRWTANYASVEIYDPALDRWSWGTPMQFERAGFGATVMDGRIYVGGGELIDMVKTLNSLEVFNPASAAWSRMPDMPAKLHGVPLVGVNGMLYMLGGSGRSADVINWGRVYALRP